MISGKSFSPVDLLRLAAVFKLFSLALLEHGYRKLWVTEFNGIISSIKPFKDSVDLVEKFDKDPKDLAISDLLLHKYC